MAGGMPPLFPVRFQPDLWRSIMPETDVAEFTESKVSELEDRVIPMFNRVIVRQEESKLKTRDGLALPENTRKKLPIGRVIKVGPVPQALLDQMPQGINSLNLPRVGDMVWFNTFAGNDIEWEGDKLRVLTYEDVLSKLPG